MFRRLVWLPLSIIFACSGSDPADDAGPFDGSPSDGPAGDAGDAGTPLDADLPDMGMDGGADAGFAGAGVGSLGPQTVRLGQTLVLDLAGAIWPASTLYDVIPLPLPAGAKLDSAAAEFRYRPGLGDIGSFSLTFRARDGAQEVEEIVPVTVVGGMPGDATSISGVILDANAAAEGRQVPLVGAVVRHIESGLQTTTQSDGSFLLVGIEPGRQHFDFDGMLAAHPDGGRYGGYRATKEIFESVDNTIARPLYLMEIETDFEVTVDPARTTSINNTRLGVRLSIPANTIKDSSGANYAGVISLSEVPVGFTPASLPENLVPSMVITVQPMGLNFAQPVPVNFPADPSIETNTEVDLWSLDHSTGQFFVAGTGRSQAGSIGTSQGGLQESSWHFFLPGDYEIDDDQGGGDRHCGPCSPSASAETGSATSLMDGSLTVERSLAPVITLDAAAQLHLVYRSHRVSPVLVASAGAAVGQTTAVPELSSVQLRVGGVTIEDPRYVSTTGVQRDGEAVSLAAAWDAQGQPSSVVPFQLRLSGHYGDATVTRDQQGQFLVLNLEDSPVGAGWSIAGVDRLVPTNGGQLLVRGDGQAQWFAQAPLASGALRDSLHLNTGFDGARSIEVANVDGVGLPEVVVASQRGSRILIYELNMQGRLQLKQESTTSSPRRFTLGDFDEDGNADLISVTDIPTFGPGVYLSLGNGSGGFGDGNRLFDIDAFSVGSADLDGDGHLDLVYNNTRQRRVHTAMGRGDGSFVVTATVAGQQALRLRIGDMNGDGALDVVLGNQNGPAVSVHLGDAMGGLSEAQTFEACAEVYDLDLADVDQDGNLDVVLVCGNGEAMAVLRGDGMGGLERAELTPGEELRSLALGDLDGDGWVDAVTAGPERQAVQVRINRGDGTFFEPVLFAGVEDALALAVGDVNGDGRADVAVGSFAGDRLKLLQSTPFSLGYLRTEGDFLDLVQQPDRSFKLLGPDGGEDTFDTAGRLTVRGDIQGNTTAYQYSGDDLVSITGPTGRVTQFASAGGHVSSVTDSAGRQYSFEHDAEGNLVTINEPDASTWRYEYDNKHRLTAQIDPLNRRTEYSYDAWGRHVLAVRPDMSRRSVVPVDVRGLPVEGGSAGTKSDPLMPVIGSERQGSFTAGEGDQIQVLTDSYGAPIRSADLAGNETLYERGVGGVLLSTTHPNGRVDRWTYDARNRPLSFREGNILKAEFEYDGGPFGRVTVERDGFRNETRWEYDNTGLVSARIDRLNRRFEYGYDTRGRLSSIQTGGQLTTFSYDAHGNLERKTDASGSVTHYTRDAAGQITGMTVGEGTAAAVTENRTYDGSGRVASQGFAGAMATYSYDSAGHISSITLPTGQTVTYVRDAMGRAVQVQSPLQGTTTIERDADGRILAVIEEGGQRSEYAYDAMGQLVAGTDAAGRRFSATHDAMGLLDSWTDANAETTVFVYDINGRRTEIQAPNGQTTRMTYDRMDRETRRTTMPDGLNRNTSYDQEGRITRIDAGGAGHLNNSIINTWDVQDNLTQIADNDSRLSFSYDAAGRLLTQTTVALQGDIAVVLNWSYDAAGNEIRRDDSLGGVVLRSHNGSGDLVSVTSPGNQTVNINPDIAGRFGQVSYPNGLSTNYVYSTAGGLDGVQVNDAMTSLLDVQLTRDAKGRIASRSNEVDTRAFAYDASGWLVQGGPVGAPQSYSYGPSGNRLTSPQSALHTYQPNGRLIEDQDFTYTYSAGFMTSRTPKAGGNSTQYAWTGDGRLRQITRPDGVVINYRYDGFGRRISKEVGGVRSNYVNAHDHEVAELDATGTVISRTTYGNLDQPLVREQGATPYFYHQDGIGSVLALSDAAGQIVNRYRYDAFGNELEATEAVPQPLRYVARPHDVESGLRQHRARYYDPTIGQFISEDPIVYLHGEPHPYRYGQSDPLQYIDTGGENPVVIVGVIILVGTAIYFSYRPKTNTTAAAPARKGTARRAAPSRRGRRLSYPERRAKAEKAAQVAEALASGTLACPLGGTTGKFIRGNADSLDMLSSSLNAVTGAMKTGDTRHLNRASKRGGTAVRNLPKALVNGLTCDLKSAGTGALKKGFGSATGTSKVLDAYDKGNTLKGLLTGH